MKTPIEMLNAIIEMQEDNYGNGMNTHMKLSTLVNEAKTVVKKYDNLFGFEFPYIMAIHQKPAVDGTEKYSHFHIEFYPPYRTKDKLKYLAGSESGAGAFINGSLPEEKAEELRKTKPFEICKE